MKNITDSVRFTADSLIPANIVGTEARAKALAFLNNHKMTDEEKAAAKADLLASLSDEAKGAFARYGVELPFDVVTVNVDLNEFLFACHDAGTVRPAAPLAIAAHQARIQKFATRLQQEEFLLDAEETKTIRNVLESDEKWKTIQFPAYVEVGEDKTRVGMTLTADGIAFYSKLLNEVVKLFGESDAAEQTKETPAV